MSSLRAVLFDLGGTLYDYRSLEAGNRESLIALAEISGVNAEPQEIPRVYREVMRKVFAKYLSRPYYLHRDLFRDALKGMLAHFGVELRPQHLRRYEELQRDLHRRDLVLRDGVLETLSELRARGFVLGIVSNIDEEQLQDLTSAAGLGPYFDWMLSSERAEACKPELRIFQIALERAGCSAGQALFVGDTLRQDIAGANRMGMPSALLWHREDRTPPLEQARPDHVIRSIPELLSLVSADKSA